LAVNLCPRRSEAQAGAVLLSTAVMLALAAWAPVLLAWICSTVWSSRGERSGRRDDVVPSVLGAGPIPPRGLPYESTYGVQCMLDTADEHGSMQLSALCRCVGATESYHRRVAFEIATLVAVLATREWAERAALDHIDPYAPPAIEGVLRSGREALSCLFDRPFIRAYSRGELALRCRRLRACLAQMRAGLRTYRQACCRTTTAHPYR
jgi:hypothetical protein